MDFSHIGNSEKQIAKYVGFALAPEASSGCTCGMSDKKQIFRISVLVIVKDAAGRFLLIERRKAPNLGCWSPVGGKLEMELGESPYECAIRELYEETGHAVTLDDLHLFGMLSEKAYEGTGHWLMFLFNCLKPIAALPQEIDEGQFGFFTREEIEQDIKLPLTDRTLLWPNYDKFHNGMIVLRADCDPAESLRVTIEQTMN